MKDPADKLGALWKKQSKSGLSYFTGIIGDQRIVVFPVREKRSDKSPDFTVLKDTKSKPSNGQDDYAF